jgi:HlyD family secretion protein
VSDFPQPVDVLCHMEGSSRILFLVPAGTVVQKGLLVCELDPAPIKDQMVNQRIALQSAEANYQNARLDRENADLAVNQYQSILRPRELEEIQDETKLAEAEIGQAEAQREAANKMGEAGKAELRQADVALLRGRLDLKKSQNRGMVAELASSGRLRELTQAVERTRNAELAKEQIVQLEKNKIFKLERQIRRCKIYAPIGGRVVHPKLERAGDPRTDRSSAIEVGAQVRERQWLLQIVSVGARE